MDQKLRLWLLRHRMAQVSGAQIVPPQHQVVDQKLRLLDRLSGDWAAPVKTHIREQIHHGLGSDGYLEEPSRPESISSLKYEAALNSLACELDRVKETEKKKIAERLHDEFGQDLVLAKMKLGLLVDELPRQYAGCVGGVTEILSDLIRRTRTVIQELYPQPPCETGLKNELQSLARQIQSKHGISCPAKLDLLPPGLKAEVQQILLRAVRELLFNVVKHAQASRASIVVTRKPGAVTLELSDNGRGFDRHKTAISELSVGRFGLFSVRANLASIGAALRIFSRPGKGTKAVITLPLNAA